MDATLIRELYDLIADDRIAEAIERLQDNLSVDHPEFTRIILLARRVRELDRKSKNATIALDEATIARNQISEGLLGVLTTLRQAPPPPPPAPPPPTVPPDPPPTTFRRDTPPPVRPAAPAGTAGFFGEVDYSGSYSKKRQTLMLPLPYDTAWTVCTRAVQQVGFTIRDEDAYGGRLTATTKGNFVTTFGERASLWLTPVDEATTRVTIIVDSKLPTMVFDWGTNQKLLNRIVDCLT